MLSERVVGACCRSVLPERSAAELCSVYSLHRILQDATAMVLVADAIIPIADTRIPVGIVLACQQEGSNARAQVRLFSLLSPAWSHRSLR